MQKNFNHQSNGNSNQNSNQKSTAQNNPYLANQKPFYQTGLLNSHLSGYISEDKHGGQFPKHSNTSVKRGQNQQDGMSDNKSSMNKSYYPVPDGRFYTKANFYTLRNNSRENKNRQYQSDNISELMMQNMSEDDKAMDHLSQTQNNVHRTISMGAV
jgi:hypothetical protein